MLSKWYSYCLELGDGYYYVGISQFPAHRIYAHKNGEGSKLSQRHGVKDIVGVWDIGILNNKEARAIETNITKGLTSVYGDKVRGAGNCNEDRGYKEHGFGIRYVQNFTNVTDRIKGKLSLIEKRGWA